MTRRLGVIESILCFSNWTGPWIVEAQTMHSLLDFFFNVAAVGPSGRPRLDC